MNFEPYVAKGRIFNDISFDFWIQNETGKSWYDLNPNQSMPERQWCAAHLKPGMRVVDCGAHHGIMSVIFAKMVGDAGIVYAYEAMPENAEVIEKNAVLNALNNVVVRPVAIGDRRQRMVVSANLSNSVVLGKAARRGEVAVDVMPLDNDASLLGHVDFIKIDVEGSDLLALRGMKGVLRNRPIIDFELHNFIFDDRRKTLKDIVSILRNLKYKWSLLGGIADDVVGLGELDVDAIIKFDNPHLFGLPN